MNPDNKPIMDVSRPGAVAATPSGKPIITANKPIVKDPMMSSQNSGFNSESITKFNFNEKQETANVNPEGIKTDAVPDMSPEQYAEETRNSANEQKSNLNNLDLNGDNVNPETGHTLVADKAVAGQFNTSKKGRILLIILLLLVLAVGGYFGYMFLLT